MVLLMGLDVNIFTSTFNSKDYHVSMNHAYFEEWFNKLLESLNESSVIILDNASYHSRIYQ
jgi:transposase